jgi:hypothetical protein
MTEKQYAFIKNNEVVNTAMFEDPNTSLLSVFKEERELDDILECPSYVFPGFTWDGTDFISPSPFPSWLMDTEKKAWVAPIEQPEEGGPFIWDEPNLSWKSIVDEDLEVSFDPNFPEPTNP